MKLSIAQTILHVGLILLVQQESALCCNKKILKWFFNIKTPGYPDWGEIRPNYRREIKGTEWNESDTQFSIKYLNYGHECNDTEEFIHWQFYFLTNHTALNNQTLHMCDQTLGLFCNKSHQCDCMYQMWQPGGFLKTRDVLEPHFLTWDEEIGTCDIAENSGCSYPYTCGRNMPCVRTTGPSGHCVCNDTCLPQKGQLETSKATHIFLWIQTTTTSFIMACLIFIISGTII